jgi:hypothetical protein
MQIGQRGVLPDFRRVLCSDAPCAQAPFNADEQLEVFAGLAQGYNPKIKGWTIPCQTRGVKAMSVKATLLSLAALIAVLSFSTAAFAVPAACFSGVWLLNKTLSPNYQGSKLVLLAPFGDNGWVRQGGNEGPMRLATALTQMEVFNGRAYTRFGSDPRELFVTVIDDRSILSMNEGVAENEGSNVTRFSRDCARMDASPTPADKQIYDKILPQGASAMSQPAVYYGVWILNRQASAMTRPGTEEAPSKNEEHIVIAPLGNRGWGFSIVSGGYQPADLRDRGMTAPYLQRRVVQLQPAYSALMARAPAGYDWKLQRETFFATWDGTPAFTTGGYPRQVTLRRIDDRRFDMQFAYIHQPWLARVGNVRSSILFSNDGKRMTVTTSGVEASALPFENDVRVYDKADAATWPSRESKFPPAK